MLRVRGCLLLFALVAGSSLGAAATGLFRVSSREVRTEVIATVEAQLAAFRAGDIAKAYGYSSAGLRIQTNLRRFAAIVQENYPSIWANTGAQFGLVHDDGSHATVLVEVSSPVGNAVYDYVMVREPGGWRVGSVTAHEFTRKGNL